jgi:hypothetical protein
LTSLGLHDLGTIGQSGGILHPELFLGQEAQSLARWPNILTNGSWQWAYTRDCVRGPGQNCSNSNGFTWRTNSTLGPPPAVQHKWGSERAPWLHGYWTFDWRDTYIPLASVDDAKEAMLVDSAYSKDMAKANKGARYVALNLLSELDSPGEYYIDRTNGSPTRGMLYFQPHSGQWPADGAMGAFVSVAPHVIDLQGASSVSFSGLRVEHARGTAIVGTNATSITFTNTTVANGGGGGIDLSGNGLLVDNCEVYGVGGTGLAIRGGLHRSLMRSNNLVRRNYIHHYARWTRWGWDPRIQIDSDSRSMCILILDRCAY